MATITITDRKTGKVLARKDGETQASAATLVAQWQRQGHEDLTEYEYAMSAVDVTVDEAR
jgi:hypothetical protein